MFCDDNKTQKIGKDNSLFPTQFLVMICCYLVTFLYSMFKSIIYVCFFKIDFIYSILTSKNSNCTLILLKDNMCPTTRGTLTKTQLSFVKVLKTMHLSNNY